MLINNKDLRVNIKTPSYSQLETGLNQSCFITPQKKVWLQVLVVEEGV
jgi:hypothetical protein